MQTNSQITRITGRPLVLDGNDIDTDRIIPARFLRSVTFDGLGEQVFRDERFDADGKRLDHPFNDERFSGGSVLLVDANFGCGSSREHAPQALLRFGITAIIGQSFAEIFASNCTNLGIPVFTADQELVGSLKEIAEKDPLTEFDLDVEASVIRAAGQTYPLQMVESVRNALLEGTWDSLGELMKNSNSIEATYTRLPYTRGF